MIVCLFWHGMRACSLVRIFHWLILSLRLSTMGIRMRKETDSDDDDDDDDDGINKKKTSVMDRRSQWDNENRTLQ
jgi:hypothetical protein